MVRNTDAPDNGGSDGIAAIGSHDGIPDFGAARKHLLTELVRFVAILRKDGVAVPASGTLSAARALATVGLDDRQRVEAALRATLLSAPTDADPFEDAFPTFWHRLRGGFDRIATASDGPEAAGEEADGFERSGGSDTSDGSDGEADTLPEAEPPETDTGADGEVSVRIPTDRRHVSGDRPVSSEESSGRRYSAVGEREPIDAAIPTPEGGDLGAIERFVEALSTLPGRRHERSDAGGMIDARAALRESLDTGGAPLELPYTAPVPSELRCCLLVDVSGSVLDTIDRGALLTLAERLATGALSARVFLFDTELSEATEAFTRAGGDPAAALRAAEIEWGGGTKIGGAFETLRRTAPHAVDRRTGVVVVSDGLDVGDLERLSDGITWLARRAHSIVWLNPLAVSPAFEPTSRGMSTVSPYVDALFGFAEAADLGEAADQIERRGLDGRVGYEHDSRRIEAATDGGRPE